MAMTEEEKKRVMEAMKARASGGATTADPRKPTIVQPAQKEEGGILNSIASFFGEVPQMGDFQNPALQNAVNPLAKNPITGMQNFSADPISMGAQAMTLTSGLLDMLASKDADQTEVSPLTSMATAGADTASIGALNKARAAIDTGLETGKSAVGQMLDNAKAAVGLGEKDTEWAKNMEENHYMRAMEQERIRGDNLFASLGGDVLGSLAPGAALFKGAQWGAKALGWEKSLTDTWLRRALFTSAVAGTEAGAYRVTKDGDLTRAAIDAGLVFAGGTALSSFTKLVGGVRSLLTSPKASDAMKESVGAEVIRGINIERQKQGLPAVAPSDIQKMVSELGPDATLLDMFPEQLQATAKSLLSKESPELTAETLRNLIAVRNGAMENLMAPDGSLRTVLGAQRLFSPKEFAATTKAQLQALSPQYAAVLKANADTSFKAGNMIKSMQTLFGPNPTMDQREVLAAVIGNIKDVQDVVLKPQVKAKTWPSLTDIPLSSVIDIKRQLQDQLGKKVIRIRSSGRELSLTKTQAKDLQTVVDYFDDMVGEAVPALAPLNRQYAFVANGRESYNAGYKMIADTVEADDFARFLKEEGERGVGNIPAFMEGAKRGLFKRLDKAKTSQDIDRILLENKITMDKLRGMFGNEVVDQLVGTVKPAVLKIKTAEGLDAAVNTVKEATAEGVKSLSDVAVIAAQPLGITGSSLAAGALRRVLPKAMSAGLEAANPERQKIMSEVLTAKGGDAVSTIKDLLKLQQGSTGGENEEMLTNLMFTILGSSAYNTLTDQAK